MKNSTFWHWPTFRFPLLLLVFSLGLVGCDDDDSDDGTTPTTGGGNTEKALVITSGAQSLSPGGSFTYEAAFISPDGSIAPATNVSWTATSSVATISSGGVLTITTNVGAGYVTATVTEGSTTFEAQVPFAIASAAPFTVAPWAIIAEPGDTYQLEAFYPSPSGSAQTFTYASSSDQVASVNASGLVTANATGEATITVTAGGSSQTIPVLVVGPPSVALPVTRVRVAPTGEGIFRGETLQLTAEAFNADGAVTGKTFAWASSNPAIASVDANGLVTGTAIGDVAISATVDGIRGEAALRVLPDTVVIISPISATINPGANQTFEATVYNARTQTTITEHADLEWFLPEYPSLPGVDLNFATIATSGTRNRTATASVKQNALAGLTNVLIASVGGSQTASGGASLLVGIGGIGGGSDCGPGNPDVASISVASTNVSLSFFGQSTFELNAEGLDANGNPVAAPELRYNSSDELVATVSSDGTITAVGPGTATVEVCSGNFASVNVQVTVN